MQASTSLTGQTLANGKYEIAELIGEGGMGTVYRARHVSLRRTVAIKVMHREILSRPKAAARFQREARAASQLNHRNSVQVLDFGEERGMHYIVMEYVDGYDLGDVIRADGALTEERTCRLMVQVCAALARAHDSGVIHRDLKPDNIVITEGHDDDGRATELVKVCDFGIAKIQWGEPGERSDTITEAGDITGTPHFMSPEQCQALEMDARSDIYSCGIILYNMVTGDVPFDAPTPVNIMVMHVAHAPRPPREVRPSVSPEMEAIILQAIAKDPAIRQQDARELRRQLVSHLRHLGAATLDLGTSDTISAQRVAVATAVAGASGLPTAKSPAVVEPAASEPLPAPVPGGRRMAIFATLFALIGAGAAGMGLYMGSRGGSGGSSAEASHSDPAAQVARPRGARPKTPASVAASVPGPVAEAPAAAPAQPKAEPPEAATAGDSPDDEVATGADASAQDKATAESDDKGQEDEEAAGNPAGGHAAEARSKPAEPARAQAGNAPGSTGGADPVAAAGTSAPEPEPVAQREPSPVGGAAPQAASPTHRTSVPTPTPKPPAAEPADEPAAAAAREPVKTKEAVVVTAAPEVAPAPAPAAAPAAPKPASVEAAPSPQEAPPKPAIPASFEASVSVGGVSASGSLPTSAISSAAERVTSGFASCYEKAARSAGRAPATTVTVRGIIDEDGRGRKFKASGGSLPGLAACVRGVASGIRSRTRPDTGTVDATFDVQFKPKSP